MPQRWIVEHTDDDGIIGIFQYEHGRSGQGSRP
jgi:hypothetical protein